jgi:hypothetical protein
MEITTITMTITIAMTITITTMTNTGVEEGCGAVHGDRRGGPSHHNRHTLAPSPLLSDTIPIIF